MFGLTWIDFDGIWFGPESSNLATLFIRNSPNLAQIRPLAVVQVILPDPVCHVGICTIRSSGIVFLRTVSIV